MKNIRASLSRVILTATTATLATLTTSPVQAFTISDTNSTNNHVFEHTNNKNVLGAILGFESSTENVDFKNTTFIKFSQSGYENQMFNSFYTFSKGNKGFKGVFSGFSTTYSHGEETFTSAGFFTTFKSDKGKNEMPSEEVPEPLTLMGTAVALGFGALFKKRASVSAKKQ